MQYPDDVNERVIDPEKLGPGAFGLVITNWQTKSGASQCYMICNPAEEPAAPEDCVQPDEALRHAPDPGRSWYLPPGYGRRPAGQPRHPRQVPDQQPSVGPGPPGPSGG